MIWRSGERLFLVTEDSSGDLLILGKRYRVVREVTDPRERLKLDPLGELALALGLQECPYHPGVFVPEDKPCLVCAEEALEALGEEEEAKVGV